MDNFCPFYCNQDGMLFVWRENAIYNADISACLPWREQRIVSVLARPDDGIAIAGGTALMFVNTTPHNRYIVAFARVEPFAHWRAYLLSRFEKMIQSAQSDENILRFNMALLATCNI